MRNLALRVSGPLVRVVVAWAMRQVFGRDDVHHVNFVVLYVQDNQRLVAASGELLHARGNLDVSNFRRIERSVS